MFEHPRDRHIAIIGAGLLGRLLAWQLLEKGCAVTLYDKDSGQGEYSAGMVAAAMRAPLSEILDAEAAVYHHGLSGMAVWQGWVDQLNQATGIKTAFQANGSIVVTHRHDSGDYQRLVQRLRRHPEIDQHSVSLLDRAGLSELEPELGERFDRGCYLASEGCLDNHALFQALAVRIEQLGGQRQQAEVEQPASLQGFDTVVDCRGFGAAGQIPGLRGVRGEVIRVYAPEVKLMRPVRLMHPRYKLYIAPKPGDEYIIGATQIESSSEQAVTVRSSLELLSALYSVHTGFAEASIISQQARCRPAFDDNLPRIGKRGHGFFINGLYRHGYLLAPSVVQQALKELGFADNGPWPEIVNERDRQ